MMHEIKPILIAEDNPNDAELTKEAFDDCNLSNEIFIVKDGVEVLDFLRCKGSFANRNPVNPIVTILDIKMPRLDGVEVLREIRLDPQFKHLPVVMLTSSVEEQDLLKSYELGVNAYVRKPVNFSEFVSTVKELGFFWAILNETPSENDTRDL